MARAKLDRQLLSRFVRGEKKSEHQDENFLPSLNHEKEEPVRKKITVREKNDKPFLLIGENHSEPPAPSIEIENAQKDFYACTIGEFIGVICSSYGAGLYEEDYAPRAQVWFTDEEAAEACIRRGYPMTTERARKYLGQILERGHRLIESRENITIGRREYRRANIMHESAKEYFRVEAPSFKVEWPPSQEYRTRYGREDIRRGAIKSK